MFQVDLKPTSRQYGAIDEAASAIVVAGTDGSGAVKGLFVYDGEHVKSDIAFEELLPAAPAMTEFTVNYWYTHPWDATYDSEQSASIFSTSLDAAIAEFKKDYGDHNILSAYPNTPLRLDE